MSSDSRPGTTVASPPSQEPTAVGRTPSRYLLAISALSAGEERVTTGDLQGHLDVTPASVTEMLGKLDDRGLVDYEKYRGARLVPPGESVAARVAWRVCVVTGFFDSVLDTTLDDRTAFEIGFALPRAGVVRLQELATAACLDPCPESDPTADGCEA